MNDPEPAPPSAVTRPPARAAAVRGDNYQYAIAWYYACRALTDPGVESVSVEDAGGGHFDDVVVRRLDGKEDQYLQVKSSNSGSVVVDDTWLTTPATPTGQSPLQHYHRTWKSLAAVGRPFTLTLITNRGFDHEHPLLGALRDNYDSRIRVPDLKAASTRTAVGRYRDAWAEHLEIDVNELIDFLAVVRWEQAGPDEAWRAHTKLAMRLAGLRDDDEAVEIGVAIMRELVMTGSGPQRTSDLRRAVDARNLLVTSAELTLAVNAIDRPASPDTAQITLNWVDRFGGDDPFYRYQTDDPADWVTLFPADLARAREALQAYRARRLFITGASRLSSHFMVGHEFADVRGWVLSVQQRGQRWTTDAAPQAGVTARVLSDEVVSGGTDLAVALSLTNDISGDVTDFVRNRLPVGRVLVLGPEDGPGLSAVESNEWLVSWINDVRDTIRRAARDVDRIHLFMSGPAAAALLLGHRWNVVRAPVILYDYDFRTYFPTFQFGFPSTTGPETAIGEAMLQNPDR